MFELERKEIETRIRIVCDRQAVPLAALEWKPIPFSGEWGISTSFFATAAAEARSGKKLSVTPRAQELAELVKAEIGSLRGIRRVEAVKGYLNLYFDTAEYAARVVDQVLEQGGQFGAGERGGERVMVEFSHPNTHKAFHVGHLRGTILGDVICRILETAGYQVVRANYPGDMGLHVIKWLWAYLKFHAGEEPPADITQWMGDVYADASRRLEENPELEAELRAVYARWDQRDPQVVALWERTRQIYAALDIRFDKYYFNSQEEKPGKEVVEELVRRGIAIDERPQGGAVIVKIDELLGLTKEQYRTAVVLRSDGTALYATEDLALVRHKFSDYPGMEKSLYVVDVRQSLHFTQVFKILEIAGYEQAAKCGHISYELVTLPGNVVMSSREGTVVLLEGLLREATARAYAVVKTKNPALSEEQMQSVARAVGIGALKFPMLARENTRLVTFDWDSALDFNGQAAPYIQYAHVRCNSILRRAEVDRTSLPPATFTHALESAEVELVDQLSRLPGVVQSGAAEFKPLLVTSYAYDLAKAFNDFYNLCPVIQAEANVRAARLRLVAAARQTIANALALLGITAPEVM
jgi:arginyl-tRNA synthetase